MKLRKLWATIPFVSVLAISACNSGANNWQSGNLGYLTIDVESDPLLVGESTLVSVTINNAQQGTDPMGAATVNFYVMQESSMQPSNIALFNPESCIISNPLTESGAASCSVWLTGVTQGSARILAQASAPHKNGASIFESFSVVNP